MTHFLQIHVNLIDYVKNFLQPNLNKNFVLVDILKSNGDKLWWEVKNQNNIMKQTNAALVIETL